MYNFTPLDIVFRLRIDMPSNQKSIQNNITQCLFAMSTNGFVSNRSKIPPPPQTQNSFGAIYYSELAVHRHEMNIYHKAIIWFGNF